MNTPAHVIFSLSLLGRANAASYAIAIAIGALLPDALMVLFYGYQKMNGVPESVIWNEKYFLPFWQNTFDLTNSLPLLVIALALSWYRGYRWLVFLFASMILHCLLDLPVHYDDGHRHFFPFSDFRFQSPISYWDPRYYGSYVMTAEVILVFLGVIYLWGAEQKSLGKWVSLSRLRIVLLLTIIIYSGFFVFVARMWLEMPT